MKRHLSWISALAFLVWSTNAGVAAEDKGTCYSDKDCKTVLARLVTEKNCSAAGGKSWKTSGHDCVNF